MIILQFLDEDGAAGLAKLTGANCVTLVDLAEHITCVNMSPPIICTILP